MWLFILCGEDFMKKYEIVKEHKEFDDIIANQNTKKISIVLYIIRKAIMNILDLV